jgi:DNA-binding NarL/FixJ family response regulator
MSRKIYIKPQIASLVVESLVSQSSTPPPQSFSLLTERKRQVLQLTAEGRSTKQIAFDLTVRSKTVELHRRQVM